MSLIILNIISLIKFFLTLALVFLIIKWISKLFSPNTSHTNQDSSSPSHNDEGKTTIQTKNQDKKYTSNKKGEYIDFEEIE